MSNSASVFPFQKPALGEEELSVLMSVLKLFFPRMIKTFRLYMVAVIAPHTALARNRAAGNSKCCDVI